MTTRFCSGQRPQVIDRGFPPLVRCFVEASAWDRVEGY
jgi:hypothetical protein